MAHSLFITGSTGCIGSTFLQKLDPSRYRKVYCLCRDQARVPRSLEVGMVQIVRGGIFDTDTYAPYLADSETAVHFAATTGKAEKDEYFRVNATGTELFASQCRQAGVNNLLHVSTIAVKYPDKSHYYYAQSKELGELAVKGSGLRYTIVRPTVVIGETAAVWRSLSMLARAPVVPVFGDGTAKMQPIYIDDLVDILLMILSEGIFRGETYELGGPEVISFEDFLKRVHSRYFDREPRVIHIPARTLQNVLGMIEARFPSGLPVSAGQLSSFCNDGTVHLNGLDYQGSFTMKGVQEMLDLVVSRQREEAVRRGLDAECRTFTRCLVSEEPNAYVLQKYREAHAKGNALEKLDTSPFDKFILRVATQHPFLARAVDTYSALFSRGSTVRKKMILLMAMLESCAPTFSYFDVPDSDKKAVVLLRLILAGMAFALVLFLASVFLVPIHLVSSVLARVTGGDQ